MPPKQTDPQYKLRLTEELKIKLDESSRSNGRSLNSEIISRLEHSFSRIENLAVAYISTTNTIQEIMRGVNVVKLEILEMMDTLDDGRRRHLWRDIYVDSERQDIVLEAIDRFVASAENVPNTRADAVTMILGDWLKSRGYL